MERGPRGLTQCYPDPSSISWGSGVTDTTAKRIPWTLAAAGLNVATLAATFLSQVVARGYHLSVDFTDGQMFLIYCLLFATPPLTLATLVFAAVEWSSENRRQVVRGLMLTAVPALFLLLAIASVGLLQRAAQWLVGA